MEEERVREDQEKKEELVKQRKAKASLVRSNITAKSLKKNRDKYDV